MIPSNVSRAPSPAYPSPTDQAELQRPPAAPSTAPSTASNTAVARQVTSGAATAAKLRALSPLSVPGKQSGHKRFPSRDTDMLAEECGRASQVPRSAGMEAQSITFPEKPIPALRHAASTSALHKKSSLEDQSKNAGTANAAGDLTKAGSDRKRLAAQYEQTDFWKNGERAGLIRMKREDAGTGAADAVYRMAAATLIKFPDLQYNDNTKFHSTLIRQPDGTCLLADAKTKKTAPPVDGKNIFS